MFNTARGKINTRTRASTEGDRLAVHRRRDEQRVDSAVPHVRKCELSDRAVVKQSDSYVVVTIAPGVSEAQVGA